MPELEQINKVRQLTGLEPLTELPEELGGPKKKTQEEIDAEKKAAAGGGAAGGAGGAAGAEGAAGGGAGAEGGNGGELSDEALLALLHNRGIKAATLEDLKPKEDPAAVAEQKEAAELAFGLSKGLFNKREYDLFVTDTQNLQNVVYGEFYEDSKKADPDLTDEQILEEFNAKYGLDAEKGTRKYERGLKELKDRGLALVRDKHKKVLGAKDAFSKHENDNKTVSETNKKVTAALPAYKSDVNSIIAGLKKFTIKMSDDDSFDVDNTDEQLAGIKNDLLNPDFYVPLLAKGYTKEQVQQTVTAGFIAKNFPTLMVTGAKKYLEKHAAGTHGVPAGGGANKDKGNDNLEGLTENQKKMAEMVRLDRENQEKLLKANQK